MLAQSFLSAKQLGLPEEAVLALQKVLVLLETDKLRHVPEEEYVAWATSSPGNNIKKFASFFNMNVWGRVRECGTIACIGGTAELLCDVDLISYTDNRSKHNVAFHDLCYPSVRGLDLYNKITTQHAAQALRNYLTLGKANWSDILPW